MARDQVDKVLDRLEYDRELMREEIYQNHLRKRRALFLGRLVRQGDDDA